MDFTLLTVELLKGLYNFTGSYGLAIIAVTVLVRVFLWPFGISQQRSMRAMQILQPEMKRIQERYKSDPQMQQRKMMEFYKEHKFNPMSGCLPMLIQLPVFILLYQALISPAFLQEAGNSKFLFVDRLDKMVASSNHSFDGAFSIPENFNYDTGKTNPFTVYKVVSVTVDGQERKNVKLDAKALRLQGGISPDDTIDFKIHPDDFNVKEREIPLVSEAVLELQFTPKREFENVKFERKNDMLTASVPSVKFPREFNADVFALVLIFAAAMYASQKVMMLVNKNRNADPQQQQMQKIMEFMPLIMVFFFISFPIPAGVYLYMIISSIIQIVQTVVINKQLEIEDAQKHGIKNGFDLSNAKTIKPIDTKTIETDKK